jgi:hypothetical protein
MIWRFRFFEANCVRLSPRRCAHAVQLATDIPAHAGTLVANANSPSTFLQRVISVGEIGSASPPVRSAARRAVCAADRDFTYKPLMTHLAALDSSCIPAARCPRRGSRHGLEHAFGFRFETPDRVIVMSGDTAPTPSLREHCAGCDVLIHETYSLHTYEQISRKWQQYRQTHHTSSRELAALASCVKPGLLVLYHRSNAGGALTLVDSEKVLLKEIRSLYGGVVVTAHDLDVF